MKGICSGVAADFAQSVVDWQNATLSAQLVAMLLVMSLDPSDEGLLPVDRASVRSRPHPRFELGMKRVEVPTRAFAPKRLDCGIGHEAAVGRIGQTGDGSADKRADVDEFLTCGRKLREKFP